MERLIIVPKIASAGQLIVPQCRFCIDCAMIYNEKLHAASICENEYGSPVIHVYDKDGEHISYDYSYIQISQGLDYRSKLAIVGYYNPTKENSSFILLSIEDNALVSYNPLYAPNASGNKKVLVSPANSIKGVFMREGKLFVITDALYIFQIDNESSDPNPIVQDTALKKYNVPDQSIVNSQDNYIYVFSDIRSKYILETIYSLSGVMVQQTTKRHNLPADLIKGAAYAISKDSIGYIGHIAYHIVSRSDIVYVTTNDRDIMQIYNINGKLYGVAERGDDLRNDHYIAEIYNLTSTGFQVPQGTKYMVIHCNPHILKGMQYDGIPVRFSINSDDWRKFGYWSGNKFIFNHNYGDITVRFDLVVPISRLEIYGVEIFIDNIRTIGAEYHG